MKALLSAALGLLERLVFVFSMFVILLAFWLAAQAFLNFGTEMGDSYALYTLVAFALSRLT